MKTYGKSDVNLYTLTSEMGVVEFSASCVCALPHYWLCRRTSHASRRWILRNLRHRLSGAKWLVLSPGSFATHIDKLDGWMDPRADLDMVRRGDPSPAGRRTPFVQTVTRCSKKYVPWNLRSLVTFSEPYIVIHRGEKDQQDANFYLITYFN
jgi:hypothetical protein